MKVSLLFLLSLPASAQVVSERFFAGQEDGAEFGSAIAALGDLDGDGVGDVAIGEPDKLHGGLTIGSVHVCFLAEDFSTRSSVEITAGQAGFTGSLSSGDDFGSSLANLGDRDGDGNLELAVGASGDDDAGSAAGAVWVLELRPDGSVASHRKITQGQAGFSGPIADLDRFGYALGAGRDVDGDGYEDLVVSAAHTNPGEQRVFLLSLDAEANVLSQQVITAASLGLSGSIQAQDDFGASVALLGDVDGNGVCDLAIGVPGLDTGFVEGAVIVVFLDGAGGVIGQSLVAGPSLPMGRALSSLGDLDGNGVPDILTSRGGQLTSSALLLFLDSSGSLVRADRFGHAAGGFETALSALEGFGSALAFDDLDGDGRGDFLVGAENWGSNRGRTWFLRGSPPPFVHATPAVFPALVPGTAATLALEGRGYGPLSSVTIGGMAVDSSRVVVESATRLRVDLPQLPSLGTYEVSVAPSGGSAPGFDVIEIVAPTTPALQIGNGNVGAPFANMVFSNEGLDVTVAGSPGQTHWVLFSDVQLPSIVPGLVSLSIGNAFTSLDLAVSIPIPAAGWAHTTLALPNVTAFWNFQSVTLDVGRPIPVSNLQQALVIPL